MTAKQNLQYKIYSVGFIYLKIAEYWNDIQITN
jgi:hypothetical protein